MAGWLALGLIAAWIGLVAGVVTVRRLRRGDDLPLRIRDRPGTAQWWARVIGSLATLLAVGAALAALAGLGSFEPLDRDPVRALGVILVAFGVAATITAQIAMGDSWRGDVDPAARNPLVTDGPFAIVRNPVLTANAVAALGVALVVPNVLSALMLVAVVTAYQVQVRFVEEPYLLAVHGEAYRRYAERTGRFLPGIGRLRAR